MNQIPFIFLCTAREGKLLLELKTLIASSRVMYLECADLLTKSGANCNKTQGWMLFPSQLQPENHQSFSQFVSFQHYSTTNAVFPQPNKIYFYF